MGFHSSQREKVLSKFKIDYPVGATPLDPNELNGLIPDYITTQGELNLLEQTNILNAETWVKNKKSALILSELFFRELHSQMFKDVWRWAGKYRNSDKNIGVPKEKIREEISKLIADANYWIQNQTYPWDELAARFHHRTVWIHAFPNGNGRHARLLTDALVRVHEQEPLTWGEELPEDQSRQEYLAALREADQKKFQKLIQFLRL